MDKFPLIKQLNTALLLQWYLVNNHYYQLLCHDNIIIIIMYDNYCLKVGFYNATLSSATNAEVS